MSKRAAIIATGFVAAALLYLLFNENDFPAGKPEICFGGKCYAVELARTPQEWQRGLMQRDNLALDKGMLFVFPGPSVHNFWMKDTHIALDMVWMDAGGRVLFIQKNAMPCKENVCPLYGPGTEASYVLEINAGQADAIGIKEGDIAVIKE